mmetsp:Transcript_22112/g.63347  ORF Transcript_22112/g.63347 Transcript_22112/m.63347 type:complete len:201 (+) Transcript_22112:258-860(+)
MPPSMWTLAARASRRSDWSSCGRERVAMEARWSMAASLPLDGAPRQRCSRQPSRRRGSLTPRRLRPKAPARPAPRSAQTRARTVQALAVAALTGLCASACAKQCGGRSSSSSACVCRRARQALTGSRRKWVWRSWDSMRAVAAAWGCRPRCWPRCGWPRTPCTPNSPPSLPARCRGPRRCQSSRRLSAAPPPPSQTSTAS